jgi:hypothetical protein
MPKPTAVYPALSAMSVSTRGTTGQTPVTGEESRRTDMSCPQMLLPGTETAETPHHVTPSAVGQLGLLLLKIVAAAW